MRIQADYNEIRATGTNLQRQSQEYESLMGQMIARMNELQSVWQGSDAQAFLTQLEALRPKMLKLKTAIDTYGNLLIADASAYEQHQANRTANARML